MEYYLKCKFLPEIKIKSCFNKPKEKGIVIFYCIKNVDVEKVKISLLSNPIK